MIKVVSSLTKAITYFLQPKFEGKVSLQKEPLLSENELFSTELVSDNLPSCTQYSATLKKTKQNEISFSSKVTNDVIFSDDKAMYQWLIDNTNIDIWEIQDLRSVNSQCFYIFRKQDDSGYDIYLTKDEIFDQIKTEFGVLWKIEDLEKNQVFYKCYKKGIFKNYYADVKYENLIYVVNNLIPNSPYLQRSSTFINNRNVSWKKSIAVCVLGGLFLSQAGSVLKPSQESHSDAILSMKEMLGPSILRTTFVYQKAIQIAKVAAVMSMLRSHDGSDLRALSAGIMMLCEYSKAESLCPREESKYKSLGDKIAGITAYDDNVYLTYRNAIDTKDGMQIVGVSDKKNPVPYGYTPIEGFPKRVAYSNNSVFVANELYGLQIFDVAKDLPFLIGNLSTSAFDVDVTTYWAYVTIPEGLQIIEITNLKKPFEVGSFTISSSDISRKVVASQFHNFVLVTDRQLGLFIIDVSNEQNPVLAVRYTPAGGVGVYDAALWDTYAYLLIGGTEPGFQIIDLSVYTNPEPVSTYPINGKAIALFGDYIFITTPFGGLKIFNVIDKKSPSLIGSFEVALPNSANDIVLLPYNFVIMTDEQGYFHIINWYLPCPETSINNTTSAATSDASEPVNNFFLKI